MTRQDAEKRLNRIIEESTNAYDYEIVIKEWSNYGKNRLYISIIETCKNSKHYAKYDFGFIDMDTNEYHAGKKDITRNFNLAGAKFEEKEEIEEKEEEENMKNDNHKECTQEELMAVLNEEVETEIKYAPERTAEEIKEAFFKSKFNDGIEMEFIEHYWNHTIYQISCNGRKEFFDTEKEANRRKDELIERFGIKSVIKTVPRSEQIIYMENHRKI